MRPEETSNLKSLWNDHIMLILFHCLTINCINTCKSKLIAEFIHKTKLWHHPMRKSLQKALYVFLCILWCLCFRWTNHQKHAKLEHIHGLNFEGLPLDDCLDSLGSIRTLRICKDLTGNSSEFSDANHIGQPFMRISQFTTGSRSHQSQQVSVNSGQFCPNFSLV